MWHVLGEDQRCTKSTLFAHFPLLLHALMQSECIEIYQLIECGCGRCRFVEERNSLGSDRLFVHHDHKSFKFLCSLYEDYDHGRSSSGLCVVDAKLTQGVSGLVQPDDSKGNCLPGR